MKFEYIIECIMVYMYLYFDVLRVVLIIRLFKIMWLFVVVVIVEIIIYDIMMDRNIYFVEYFIVVIVVYYWCI